MKINFKGKDIMKKTYMTPAISVMAMETAAILAGSNLKVTGARPSYDVTASEEDRINNQFSKEHTFDVWED